MKQSERAACAKVLWQQGQQKFPSTKRRAAFPEGREWWEQGHDGAGGAGRGQGEAAHVEDVAVIEASAWGKSKPSPTPDNSYLPF